MKLGSLHRYAHIRTVRMYNGAYARCTEAKHSAEHSPWHCCKNKRIALTRCAHPPRIYRGLRFIYDTERVISFVPYLLGFSKSTNDLPRSMTRRMLTDQPPARMTYEIAIVTMASKNAIPSQDKSLGERRERRAILVFSRPYSPRLEEHDSPLGLRAIRRSPSIFRETKAKERIPAIADTCQVSQWAGWHAKLDRVAITRATTDDVRLFPSKLHRWNDTCVDSVGRVAARSSRSVTPITLSSRELIEAVGDFSTTWRFANYAQLSKEHWERSVHSGYSVVVALSPYIIRYT